MNHELLLNGGFFWKHMVRFFRVEDQQLQLLFLKNSSQIDHISKQLSSPGNSQQKGFQTNNSQQFAWFTLW